MGTLGAMLWLGLLSDCCLPPELGSFPNPMVTLSIQPSVIFSYRLLSSCPLCY